MAHDASFDIRTAREFFDEVVQPECDAFVQHNSSRWHALLAIICIYHLYEWHFRKKFQKASFLAAFPQQFAVADFLEIARHIANGTKHFKPQPITTRRQGGFSSDFSDDFARPLMIEVAKGNEVSVDALLRQLVAYWKSVI